MINNLEDKSPERGKFSELRQREVWIHTYPLMQESLCNICSESPSRENNRVAEHYKERLLLHLHCLAAAPDVVSRAATLPQFTTMNQGEMLAHLNLVELWLQQGQNSSQALVASRDAKVCSQIRSTDIYITKSCSWYFYFEGTVLWKPLGCSCIINFLQL